MTIDEAIQDLNYIKSSITKLNLRESIDFTIDSLRAQQEREKMRCYSCVNECNSEDCPVDYHKQTDYCSYYEPYKESNDGKQ